MPNWGVLDGVSKRQWQPYIPKLIAGLFGGSATQPSIPNILSGDGTWAGRYLSTPDICFVQARIDMPTGFTPGVGNYAVSLPVPAVRSNEFPFDRPLIGSAHVSRGFHLPNLPVSPVLCDPFDDPFNRQTETADSYAMFFTPTVGYAAGTATITSAATTVVVNHGLNYAPAASDILVVPTNNTTTDSANWWISSISATQFTINVRTAPGVSTATFAWKINQQHSASNQFVGAGSPWIWAAGDELEMGVAYEPKFG